MNGYEIAGRERKAARIADDFLRHLTMEERARTNLLDGIAQVSQEQRDAWARAAGQKSPSPATWARMVEILRERLEADAKAPRCGAQYQIGPFDPVHNCILPKGHDGLHDSGRAGWPEWASARRVG